ncbi:DNA polymerase III subunit epsilon [Curvibacter sp. CHRR-16]|uniref:exonuclease domain-containing protein n=1 Tax=Curvibacter sp. CHRR-16 TaxID=2835872 RepID=UPI001BDB6CD2|nr:exonuclease domain-containing protein [Curvibacter sp. CHRR-16]MBT0569203.1 DNA polymerase III subunit epsilon [Curvibacter sp. CHRR-16]
MDTTDCTALTCTNTALGAPWQLGLPAPLPCMVVLDLETTGGTAQTDRVTEIAAVRLQDGVEVARMNQLVNPGIPIPPFIQQLTGINDAMVAQAPSFAAVAPELLQLLQGAVLVAHNVRFDHGFLVQECLRAGLTLSVPTLCSVRLSRALYPQYKGHGLDAIMARHGISTDARHRAMADVQVVLQWMQAAQTQLGAERLQQVAHNLLQGSSYLPPHLQTPLADLPTGHGVYAFLDANGALLWSGKSSQLRRRVLAQFQAASQDAALKAALEATHHIHWVETAGELGAQLTEQTLRRTLPLPAQPQAGSPIPPRGQQRNQHPLFWRLIADANAPGAWPQAQLLASNELHQHDLARCHGPYRSKRQALETLRNLADRHGLCLHALGLESAKGPCSARQMGHCHGCCTGEESRADHLGRVQTALAKERLPAWPYAHAVLAISETHAPTETASRCDVHVFDNWCHVGTLCQVTNPAPAHWQERVLSLYRQHQANGKALPFDWDVYRLLAHRIPGVLSPARHDPHLHTVALPSG